MKHWFPALAGVVWSVTLPAAQNATGILKALPAQARAAETAGEHDVLQSHIDDGRGDQGLHDRPQPERRQV
jgi:hypothetical protein